MLLTLNTATRQRVAAFLQCGFTNSDVRWHINHAHFVGVLLGSQTISATKPVVAHLDYAGGYLPYCPHSLVCFKCVLRSSNWVTLMAALSCWYQVSKEMWYPGMMRRDTRNIVLYVLHSTPVLSFDIDVVLTLSTSFLITRVILDICCLGNDYYVFSRTSPDAKH